MFACLYLICFYVFLSENVAETDGFIIEGIFTLGYNKVFYIKFFGYKEVSEQ